MKKLLLIISLFPLLVSAQGFSLLSNSASFGNSATLTMNSGTYTAGNTYIFFVCTTTSSGVPTDNPTVSSGSLTLTKQGTVTGTNSRIIVYSCVVASTTTTSITFTYAQTQAQHFFAIYFSANLTGFSVISVASGSGTSADPSITLPSSKSSCSIGYFFNNRNPFTGSPETGWTEDFDNGDAIPNGQAGYHRNSTTDNTIQVTSASSTWVGIAIQYSSKRRIFNQ